MKIFAVPKVYLSICFLISSNLFVMPFDIIVDLSTWRSKIMEEMTCKEDEVETEIGEVIQQVFSA